eukprot:CAMPEP_0194030958 /NCGR_PEP_ID=MMETSP0009_2-20130614/4263_1 /TAXON_ID=210454 /ORGANISM="Grammatophora oceanica, Strain CCMP 410" /LENGTH=453 /DNA_ID=CAMNT_0038671001 /DNA_START=14 /DNA_END=1375 /DNA_ORIENTATION=+
MAMMTIIIYNQHRPSSLIVRLLFLLIVTIMAAAAASFQVPRHVVVIGGGIQGTSVAYHIAKKSNPQETKITLLESKEPASAASGKGGGFMARSWGDGTSTQKLHEVGFDLYEDLAKELKVSSYRKLPVLSVSPGFNRKGQEQARKKFDSIMPDWLDGKVGRISPMGMGDDTAQVTPKEFVSAMLEQQKDRIDVVLGTCVGIETTTKDDGSEEEGVITGVKYVPRGSDSDNEEPTTLKADAMIVSAGPWSCAAEDWFHGAVELPMEGIKSTSIVWKKPDGVDTVDATALFCGEDDRFGTHLEVYPRPDGSIYICGIGGSDYIQKDQLKNGAFREVCDAKEQRVQAASQSFQTMSDTYAKSGQLDRVQACMRPCPPDAKPYMGPVPNYQGAYMNAGHNCWGIAWAPACGLAMAELVLEGSSKTINLAPFDPARFTSKTRGGRGRKRRGQNVGEQW